MRERRGRGRVCMPFVLRNAYVVYGDVGLCERERQREYACHLCQRNYWVVYGDVGVCAYVCVWERERESTHATCVNAITELFVEISGDAVSKWTIQKLLCEYIHMPSVLCMSLMALFEDMSGTQWAPESDCCVCVCVCVCIRTWIFTRVHRTWQLFYFCVVLLLSKWQTLRVCMYVCMCIYIHIHTYTQNMAAPLLLCCVIAVKVADSMQISNLLFVANFSDFRLLDPVSVYMYICVYMHACSAIQHETLHSKYTYMCMYACM
jgi:hypothetical protein